MRDNKPLKTRIAALQILRAFAALSVVITHIDMRIPYFRFIGDVGVDIFFILSGFLMSYTYSEKRTGLKFIKARIERIYPSYIILSLPLIISCSVFWSDSTKISNIFHNLTLIPSFSSSYDRANIVNWTLSYEMYFYIIFAISSTFLKKSTIISSFFSNYRINISFDTSKIHYW